MAENDATAGRPIRQFLIRGANSLFVLVPCALIKKEDGVQPGQSPVLAQLAHLDDIPIRGVRTLVTSLWANQEFML